MNNIVVTGILAAAVAGSGVGLVYTKHEGRKKFAELQTLQAYRDHLEIEWGLLQLEQSTIATDAVIDYTARTQLKMIQPAIDAVNYVNK
jgi:cell division protein FtsL